MDGNASMRREGRSNAVPALTVRALIARAAVAGIPDVAIDAALDSAARPRAALLEMIRASEDGPAKGDTAEPLAIIGCGRLGLSMAVAFGAAGHEVG
jgi:hypothetical protein